MSKNSNKNSFRCIKTTTSSITIIKITDPKFYISANTIIKLDQTFSNFNPRNYSNLISIHHFFFFFLLKSEFTNLVKLSNSPFTTCYNYIYNCIKTYHHDLLARDDLKLLFKHDQTFSNGIKRGLAFSPSKLQINTFNHSYDY